MNSKLPKYPAYKTSGVEWLGEIPEHWKLLSLKRVILSNDGGVWNENISEEGVAVYRSTEINVDGTWNSTPPIRLELKEKELLKSLLKYNDLIVTKSSGSSEHIGKTAIYKKNEIAAYSNFMQRIRFNSDFYNPDFYFYVLNSNISKYQYQVLTKSTSGLGNLNGEILNNLITIAPPFIEQSLIASFLHRKITLIDQAIGIKLKQIDLLKERRQILIHRAVTRGLNPDVKLKDSGVEWIGEIPEHWEAVSNRILFQERNEQGNESLAILSVSIHTAVSSEELSEEDNLHGKNRIADKSNYKLVKPNDIVFNMMRAWPGAIGAVRVNGMVSPAYVVAEPIVSISSDFFEFQYRTSAFIQQMERFSKGITDFRKRLYWNEFKQLKTILPPFSEQKEIITYIETITNKIATAISLKEKEIEKLKEYKASLINEVVTGKIKVN